MDGAAATARTLRSQLRRTSDSIASPLTVQQDRNLAASPANDPVVTSEHLNHALTNTTDVYKHPDNASSNLSTVNSEEDQDEFDPTYLLGQTQSLVNVNDDFTDAERHSKKRSGRGKSRGNRGRGRGRGRIASLKPSARAQTSITRKASKERGSRGRGGGGRGSGRGRGSRGRGRGRGAVTADSVRKSKRKDKDYRNSGSETGADSSWSENDYEDSESEMETEDHDADERDRNSEFEGSEMSQDESGNVKSVVTADKSDLTPVTLDAAAVAVSEQIIQRPSMPSTRSRSDLNAVTARSHRPEPACPALTTLVNNLDSELLTAQVEAGGDVDRQTKSHQAVIQGLTALPTQELRSHLVTTFNRYQTFCYSESVNVPLYPITEIKTALFLARAADTITGHFFRMRFVQDPSTIQLPVVSSLPESNSNVMEPHEGGLVTPKLMQHWIDAMQYLQLCTEGLWVDLMSQERLTRFASSRMMTELVASVAYVGTVANEASNLKVNRDPSVVDSQSMVVSEPSSGKQATTKVASTKSGARWIRRGKQVDKPAPKTKSPVVSAEAPSRLSSAVSTSAVHDSDTSSKKANGSSEGERDDEETLPSARSATTRTLGARASELVHARDDDVDNAVLSQKLIDSVDHAQAMEVDAADVTVPKNDSELVQRARNLPAVPKKPSAISVLVNNVTTLPEITSVAQTVSKTRAPTPSDAARVQIFELLKPGQAPFRRYSIGTEPKERVVELARSKFSRVTTMLGHKLQRGKSMPNIQLHEYRKRTVEQRTRHAQPSVPPPQTSTATSATTSPVDVAMASASESNSDVADTLRTTQADTTAVPFIRSSPHLTRTDSSHRRKRVKTNHGRNQTPISQERPPAETWTFTSSMNNSPASRVAPVVASTSSSSSSPAAASGSRGTFTRLHCSPRAQHLTASLGGTTGLAWSTAFPDVNTQWSSMATMQQQRQHQEGHDVHPMTAAVYKSLEQEMKDLASGVGWTPPLAHAGVPGEANLHHIDMPPLPLQMPETTNHYQVPTATSSTDTTELVLSNEVSAVKRTNNMFPSLLLDSASTPMNSPPIWFHQNAMSTATSTRSTTSQSMFDQSNLLVQNEVKAELEPSKSASEANAMVVDSTNAVDPQALLASDGQRSAQQDQASHSNPVLALHDHLSSVNIETPRMSEPSTSDERTKEIAQEYKKDHETIQNQGTSSLAEARLLSKEVQPSSHASTSAVALGSRAPEAGSSRLQSRQPTSASVPAVNTLASSIMPITQTAVSTFPMTTAMTPVGVTPTPVSSGVPMISDDTGLSTSSSTRLPVAIHEGASSSMMPSAQSTPDRQQTLMPNPTSHSLAGKTISLELLQELVNLGVDIKSFIQSLGPA
ncbi:hypothetical protein OIO90_003242 [Microbotryomycetes sp. JL221]|nr:hypothetical protein OIO90_003242 [Microbotryomycetes sp. JL221]